MACDLGIQNEIQAVCILKVRWNSRMAWCWCVVWPSRTSQKKGLLPASFRWPPWIRGGSTLQWCSASAFCIKKTANFDDGQQSQFKLNAC